MMDMEITVFPSIHHRDDSGSSSDPGLTRRVTTEDRERRYEIGKDSEKDLMVGNE